MGVSSVVGTLAVLYLLGRTAGQPDDTPLATRIEDQVGAFGEMQDGCPQLAESEAATTVLSAGGDPVRMLPWLGGQFTYTRLPESTPGLVLLIKGHTPTEFFEHSQLESGDVFLRLGCDFKETASGRPQLVVSVSSRGFRNCTFSYRPTVVEGTAKCNFAKSNLRRNRRSMRHAGTQITKTKRSEGSVVLNVEEGDSTEITEDMLRPDLPDAIGNEASFKIVSPPEHGDIYVDEESSREFTRDQLEQENVVYVHGGEEIGQSAVYDRFTVATLGENGTIKKVTEFQVSIGPVDDDPPRLNVERSLEVSEGGRVVVDVLQLLDRDTGTEDIACRVVASPSFGHLEAPPGNSLGEGEFKWSLVESGLLIYVQSDHADGLEPKEDAFTVACHDPPDNTGLRPDNLALVPVIIRGTDDEPPRLVAPLLLVLPAGLQELPLARLRITDPDTPLDRVAFTVNRQPAMGKLVLKRDVTVGPVKQFKFGDLDSVFYQYEGGETGGTDDFLLGVYDGLQGSEATIEVEIEDITGRENEAPMMVINEGLEVSQGGTGLITSALLNVHSEDGEVVYVVRDVPLFGSLLLEDTLLQPGSNFTGNDLNEGRLSYVHADPTSSMDVFVFDASDGTGILANQNFFITIRGNGSYPVVTSKTPVLPRGGSLVLDSSLLSARDRNSEDSSSLEFHVMSQPKQGAFEWVDSLGGVQVFTQKDLADGKIRYVHYNSSSFSPPPEIVQFEVTDGHRSVFHSFTINFTREEEDTSIYPPTTIAATVVITSADVAHTTTSAVTTTSGYEDGEPIELVRNAPLTYLLGGAAVGATLTAQHLMALDPDHTTTTYVVRRPPQNGSILDKNTRQPLERFTQDDINEETVFYLLDEGSNATGDSFLFDVIGRGKSLKGIKFSMKWSWVAFVEEFHTVPELPHEYNVKISRRGYIDNMAFVDVSVIGGNASSKYDYNIVLEQVQFSPGQNVVNFPVRIQNDNKFEGPEEVVIALEDSYFTVIEGPNVTKLIITDYDDEPKMNFKGSSYTINEKALQFSVPITREGDLSMKSTVTCNIHNGTAVGDNVDFFMNQSSSVVHFDEGVSENYCTVSIIDDDLLESDEYFFINLSHPTGSILGNIAQTRIVIQQDDNDLPKVSFANNTITVEEDVGKFEITIKLNKLGHNISASVDVLSNSLTAIAEEDYMMVHRKIFFPPNIDHHDIQVYIIDDLVNPKLEGQESFIMYLSNPINCIISDPSKIEVVIDDAMNDVPTVQFTSDEFHIQEIDEVLNAGLVRTGDLSAINTVICYTEEATANSDDYFERPENTQSSITFYPGETHKNCMVILKDDTHFERSERFTLKLKALNSSLKVGSQDSTNVIVTDSEDYDSVKFEKQFMFVSEPSNSNKVGHVKVPIVRNGDISTSLEVHVFTKDGTAKSGIDYLGKSRRLKFEPNNKSLIYDVQILHDELTEMREAFTVHLEMLGGVSDGDEKPQRATVFIYDTPHSKELTFPSPPIVTSLWNYRSDKEEPRQGNPLICKTVCNKKHKLHKQFSHWCKKNKVGPNDASFHWQVEDSVGQWTDIPLDIFFANTTSIILESIYFRSGFKIRCGARPISENGKQGKETFSTRVEISDDQAVCPPPVHNMMGAEPFTSDIIMTGGNNGEPNTKFRIVLKFPHYDGMFPAFSTQKLSDLSQSLQRDGPRAEMHKCSNLLKRSEESAKTGFNNPGDVKQNDEISNNLRSQSALRIYQHLDTESCMWSFESKYEINELISVCGASITTKEDSSGKSAFTINLPIYVSYITPSLKGWQHADSFSSLKLSFLYDTSLISQEGLIPHKNSQIEGILYPMSMHISNNGSLVVNFRTQPKFPGYFILHHPLSRTNSSVISRDNSDLQLTLELIGNKTRNGTMEQLWTFKSNFANADYTGKYEVSLIPCVHTQSSHRGCIPESPVKFPMDIYFQQPMDPIPQEYTLNTTFHLIRKRQLPEVLPSTDYTVFEIGDQIYGFISLNSFSEFKSQMDLKIDKCYLCTGLNGYVPKYNPGKKEYGCLAKTNKIMHTLKIIDRQDPMSVTSTFYNKPFKATLSEDVTSSVNTLINTEKTATDVFSFDLTPLFGHNNGRTWYVQCTYMVQSSALNRLKKRSIQTGKKDNLLTSKLITGKGTNMHQITLSQLGTYESISEKIKVENDDMFQPSIQNKDIKHNDEELYVAWFIAALVMFFIMTVIISVFFVVCLKKKKRIPSKTNRQGQFDNIHYTVCQQQNDNVIHRHYIISPSQ